MASKLKIKVNGLVHNVTASLDTPLLYVLHNELHLHGPRFGCGLAQCGACSVLLDGKEIRSCVTPVAAVSGKSITTLEGLPALYAASRGTSAAAPALHPLQQAWIDVQVPHFGYCQNGMMIQAADLLSTTQNPSPDPIRHVMDAATHSKEMAMTPRSHALAEHEFSRRSFLRGTGTLVVGLSLAGVATAGAKADNIPTAIVASHTGALAGPPDPTQIDSWLQINPDNTVTLFHGWVELGQGTPTAVRMIAAEELGLAFEQVQAVRVDTNVSLSAFTVG